MFLLPAGADPALEFGEGHMEEIWGSGENFTWPRPSDSRKAVETPFLLCHRSVSRSFILHSSRNTTVIFVQKAAGCHLGK